MRRKKKLRKNAGIAVCLCVFIFASTPSYADGEAAPLPGDASQQASISLEDYEKRLRKEAPIKPLNDQEKENVKDRLDDLDRKEKEYEEAFESRDDLKARVLAAAEQFLSESPPYTPGSGSPPKEEKAFKRASRDSQGTDTADSERLPPKPVIQEIARENKKLVDFIIRNPLLSPQKATGFQAPAEAERREDLSPKRKPLPDSPGNEGVYRELLTSRGLMKKDSPEELRLEEKSPSPTSDTDPAFLTLDAVKIGPEIAALHLLLYPSKNVPPYLRWLLYRQLLKGEDIRAYLQAREKMREIYKRAQAGEGMLRYKGKTGITILPPVTDMGGMYALVLPKHTSEQTEHDHE